MITSAEALELLFAACPSYLASEGEWLAELRRLGQSIWAHLGHFAAHLLQLAQNGETDEFPAVFGACERLLIEGDDEVRMATKFGLLEDIQNIASHDPELDTDGFIPHLRPVSQAAWEEIRVAWDDLGRSMGYLPVSTATDGGTDQRGATPD